MTLTFVSLGLADFTDITVKGLEKVKAADKIYLEHYTSVLSHSKRQLEEFYGKDIIIATRSMVEGDENEILQAAKTQNVVLLVVGDAFSATTHSDLYLRAREANIDVDVVYNAAILTAVGVTGLQLYKFGKTTSMVFFDTDWRPQTAYDVVKQNRESGLHTLILLDIKVAEPSKSDLANENFVPQDPRFMTVNQGIEQLLEIEKDRGEKVVGDETLVVGVARLGCSDQVIKVGTMGELFDFDFGGPLHSLIVPGNLHFHEEDMLKLWK